MNISPWDRETDLGTVVSLSSDYCTGLNPMDGEYQVIINSNGDQFWFRYGCHHRDDDQPAIVCANGDRFWYRHGRRHRDGGRPAIICANGDLFWYENGVQRGCRLASSLSNLPEVPTIGYLALDTTHSSLCRDALHWDHGLPVCVNEVTA